MRNIISRLQTTKTFRDWWTKKHDGKKRIVILKTLEEVKAYLDKTYRTTDSEVTAKTEFVKDDLDNAVKRLPKASIDILAKLTTKKKISEARTPNTVHNQWRGSV